MRKMLIGIAMLMQVAFNASAQITTSGLVGKVVDEKGEILIGAAVKAVHIPTGTSYGVSTNVDGRFSISNMRVGGPYVITISYIGFQTQTRSDISLELGAPLLLNVTMKIGGSQLAEVVVSSKKDNVFNSKRTGAATNIGREQIENLPTISRSLQDFTRLTPQATPQAGGTSFGGANNRFNNITIDGAVNNDVFGLSSSGTPGGQAGTQPISLDAIQEIQVVLAPYDVTLGNFTGGGVNAVTRSGTNKFEGSVYTFARNQNMMGNNVVTNLKNSNFTDNQYGFRLGGPIIKNKLFFFVNAELERERTPTIDNAGDIGAAISLLTAQAIAQKAQGAYGYDVGSLGVQDVITQNNKVFAKLDWNLNKNNQLSLRYNYIHAFDDNITRTSTQFSFGNDAYQFKDIQHVGILELRTKLNDVLSNDLILGYTHIDDRRVINGALFPSITIANVGGFPSNTAVLGSERSSVANSLTQGIFEITDNFKINAGNHTLTIGTHNEFFSFKNLFINNINGRWDYNNVADFITNNAPARVRATYSLDPTNPQPAAQFSAAQLGFYGQDEIDAAEGLKLTVGLRVDIPVFGSTPLENPKVEADFNGYKTNMTPSSTPLVAPRLGFNYDVLGDRSIQIRGGTGVFTGRVPFVWLSNQFANSGMLFGTIDKRNPSVFVANPNNQQSAATGSKTVEVDLVSNTFRVPQVFRSNLAIDFKLPFDIRTTLEGIYSKTINSIVYSDLNLKASTSAISSVLSGGADTRALYGPKVDATNFTNVILLDNATRGYTYSLTAQLQKNFSNKLSAMFAYTNMQAKSVNDGASSTALSNWNNVPQVNGPNNLPLTVSNFQIRHHLVGSFSYKIKYGRNKLLGTGLSLFYSGSSGQPYSYVYSGDLNGDGGLSNDLIYIPRTQNDIHLTTSNTVTTPVAAQWAALDNFIANDPYLSSRRGQYVERNAAETPWTHEFDVRVTQDIGFLVKGMKSKIQITLDIFNVGNLINKEWGRQYSVPNQALSLITYTGSGYTFQVPASTYQVQPILSAWSSQLGVRYIF